MNCDLRRSIDCGWGIILMLLILIFIILAVVEGGIFIEDVYFTIYNTNLNTQFLWKKLSSSFSF